MVDDDNPGIPRRSLSGLAIAGRIGIAILAVFAAYIVLGHHIPQVCHEELSDAGEAVQLCEPMGATDPRALLFLLLVVLCLLPDMSEIELVGVLRLRRVVEQTTGQARSLRSELDDLRIQSLAVSSSLAASAAASSATGNKLDVHVTNGEVRQQETGVALEDLESGDQSDMTPVETLGGYAQLAFNAGFAGLIELCFPDDLIPSIKAVVGFTLDDHAQLELTQFTADPGSPAVSEVRHSLQMSLGEDTVQILMGTDAGLAVTAWAFDDSADEHPEELVGALAVFFTDPVPAKPANLTTSELNRLTSTVATAAGSYGRLLVDLLGESPIVFTSASTVIKPSAGPTTTEGAQ